MLKVLVIGDPHFQAENLPEVIEMIKKVHQVAQEKQPNLIVVLGDLLHTHEKVHVDPLNQAYLFIQMLRGICKTYVLVGNHDMTSNGQFLNDRHWMNGMKEWDNVVIVDRIMTHEENGLHFVLAPYVYPGRFFEALATCEKDWKSADCIFAHQELRGCQLGSMISEEGDTWPETYPLVISGHIHTKHWSQENVYYPGSVLQHAFGEGNSPTDGSAKTISMISFESKMKPVVTEIDLGMSRKCIVYVKASDMLTDKSHWEEIHEKTEKIVQNGDKVKICISGTSSDLKQLRNSEAYKSLSHNSKATKIVLKPEIVKSSMEVNISVDHDEEIPDLKIQSFESILEEKILSKTNPLLFAFYEEIVNNRDKDNRRIMILLDTE